MVYAYGELATNPHAARSWQFIVPVVANILAYSGAQLKIFLPLFIVVWRDRQSRLVANARMSKVQGMGLRTGRKGKGR
ncbi:hypothetical protein BCR44DRAFT_37950 [Catenaria anguillulae PL171]|uniref:Uncharacterized protein n=1 Tax=Catenaria anguillulae PL171 TaxID=765915 RepID=A0A1Y2HYJ2_9FUNG|nr:hypothetical protein BCR44DRAFT_37950 [Catenaria anguillulae PL171]